MNMINNTLHDLGDPINRDLSDPQVRIEAIKSVRDYIKTHSSSGYVGLRASKDAVDHAAVGWAAGFNPTWAEVINDALERDGYDALERDGYDQINFGSPDVAIPAVVWDAIQTLVSEGLIDSVDQLVNMVNRAQSNH